MARTPSTPPPLAHDPPPPLPPARQLTTVGGKLAVEREVVTIETPELDPSLIFEQARLTGV